MYGTNAITKLNACDESARCYVVMFFKPALLVAPAPRISWEDRELNNFNDSNRLVPISRIILGMLVMRNWNSSMLFIIATADSGSVYFYSSMTALRTFSFPEPLTAVPLVWAGGSWLWSAGNHILEPSTQSSMSFGLASRIMDKMAFLASPKSRASHRSESIT